jgi:hypothetical protein
LRNFARGTGLRSASRRSLPLETMRRRLPLLVLLLALAVPASAQAGTFPGDPIDGPAAGLRLDDLDLARDGTGGVAYVRPEGVFVSRFIGGRFQAPEGLGPGGPGAGAAVAAGSNGRLAVVFSSGGLVYASLKIAGDQPWGAPVLLGAGTDPAADMSINNTAYASFTQAGNVVVARLDRRTNAWALVPLPADVEPGANAGTGALRSKVAVSADGVGIITWGEQGIDGRTHVLARKVFGLSLSTAPQDLTLPTGGSADTPEVDAEDDSSFAWVTFRQTIDGVSRTLARRQRGTAFDDAVFTDGGNAAVAPRVAISGRGEGLLTSTGGASGIGGVLHNDLLGQAFGVGPGGGTLTAPAMAENSDGMIAFAQPGGIGLRQFDAGRGLPDVALTRAELGPVDVEGGLAAEVDRADDGIVVWTQGSAAARTLVAGYADRPPLAFALSSGTGWRNPASEAAPLRWAPAFELWGPVTYTVLVGNTPVGQSTNNVFRATAPLPEGRRTWRVLATDLRGQTTRSKSKTVRIDMTPPRLTVRVEREGGISKIRWSARDVPRPLGSSGFSRVRVDFGDGGEGRTVRSNRGSVSHRYRRSATLRVIAIDKAGNQTVVERPVTRRT